MNLRAACIAATARRAWRSRWHRHNRRPRAGPPARDRPPGRGTAVFRRRSPSPRTVAASRRGPSRARGRASRPALRGSAVADGTVAQSHDAPTFIAGAARLRTRPSRPPSVGSLDGDERAVRVASDPPAADLDRRGRSYTSPRDTQFHRTRAARHRPRAHRDRPPRGAQGRDVPGVLLERPAGGRFGAARLDRRRSALPRAADLHTSRRPWPSPSGRAAILRSRGRPMRRSWSGVRPARRSARAGRAARHGPSREELAGRRVGEGCRRVTWFDNPRNGDGNGSMTVRAAVRPANAARFGRAPLILDRIPQGGVLHGRRGAARARRRAAQRFITCVHAGRDGQAGRPPRSLRVGAGRSTGTRRLSAPGTWSLARAIATSPRPR